MAFIARPLVAQLVARLGGGSSVSSERTRASAVIANWLCIRPALRPGSTALLLAQIQAGILTRRAWPNPGRITALGATSQFAITALVCAAADDSGRRAPGGQRWAGGQQREAASRPPGGWCPQAEFRRRRDR